ncbi:MAG: hypothetical protein KJ592_00370 [Nanoarchaeota archaeon]|nr:hypothetical protein [Nanoarchaeota archaeon]
MTEEKQKNMKTGILEGILDGVMMKTFWNSETARAEKDFSYLVGNCLAGAVQPGAYACVGLDLARDRYNF